MGHVFTRRIMGVETEFGIHCPATDSPEDAARVLFRPITAAFGSTNVFTDSSFRLYLDVGSHPEVATPECDSLHQLMVYDRAGEKLMEELRAKAQETLGAPFYLFRNNVDSAGNSYGCHENYLIGRDVSLKKLGVKLLPFLVTRQLLCGAGGVRNGRYQYSQRADHMWDGVSSATTRARPMINTRDEPHADSSRFRRMHVIVGDTNVAEPSLALKVGSTLLVLEMLEADYPLPNVELAHAPEAIRAAARGADIELVSGPATRAVDIQRAYLDAAKQYSDDSGRADADPLLAKVLDLWARTIAAIEVGDHSGIEHEVDWAIKYSLLHRYREKHGLEWDHPRLAQLDLTYHDIAPMRGIGRVLESKGIIQRWTSPAEVEQACRHAPPTTRAHLRGQFLRRAREREAVVTVDWLRLKANRPEPKVVELPDPFQNTSAAVEELIAYTERGSQS